MSNINKTSQNVRAFAIVKGSNKYPDITGVVQFSESLRGIIVTARIYGLPYTDLPCSYGIYGFHIHNGEKCSGNDSDPFADTDGHYNPHDCPHPYHAGDMPPLFGNKGYAYMSFLTDRFTLNEVIGKTVVIHQSPDDFKTQPSGNSGEKIACGVIALL